MSFIRKPLVDFGTKQRATLGEYTGESDRSNRQVLLEQKGNVPELQKNKNDRKSRKSRKYTRTRRKEQSVKDRDYIRVPINNLAQSITPFHLIRHIPTIKVNLAAQHFLGLQHKQKKRVSKRKRRNMRTRQKKVKRRRRNRNQQ